MRGPGRLFWKLFLGSLLLAALVLTVSTWVISRGAETFSNTALQQNLEAQARVLANVLEDRIDPSHADELNQLAKKIGSESHHPIRITFILPDGRVIGDSMADPAEMENHARRREVIEALRDGWGEDVHLSHTVGKVMRYVAVRIGPAKTPRGVVRVAMSSEFIGARGQVLQNLVWTIFGVAALALAVFALGLARLWSQPIRNMTIAARSLSRGDFSARIRVRGRDEVADLARSLNQMRDHLANQLETIDRQRRILESLLSQLLEGVVVVGADGRVILINPAAVRLLGLPGGEKRPTIAFERLHVQEFISHPQLRDMLLSHQAKSEDDNFLSQTPDEHHLRESRLRVQTPEGETTLLARSSDVRLPHLTEGGGAEADDPTNIARLLVLTDVTELTQAMQVKADFAANASHELRTPLAAILGAVETLMEMDLAADPGAAQQFVQMVQRHALRMQAMVADLLDLSRLESAPDQFKPQELAVRQQLAELKARHTEGLAAKGLDWQTEVEPGITTVVANAHLLRLTLDNLVDNSIKYTDPGGFVHVKCRRVVDPAKAARWIVFEVSDNGCGIPPDLQARVFERFYQVQLARSGSLRGTGLGLSIVRHAVAAMGGKVELDSKVDEGTTVTIRIPDQD